MKDVAEKIYDFMSMVEKLCHVRRDMFRRDGTKEPDSDHIMKLSFLLMMALPYIKAPVDAQRVLELALVHDLAEAEAGDIPRLQSEYSADVRAAKKAREMDAVRKYRGLLPEKIGRKIWDLFVEYENRSTPESKLVKIFDKFEGDMQTLKETIRLERKLKNGRHEYVLDYMRGDAADAKKSGEPFIAEMQKIQLALAEKKVRELHDAGLL